MLPFDERPNDRPSGASISTVAGRFGQIWPGAVLAVPHFLHRNAGASGKALAKWKGIGQFGRGFGRGYSGRRPFAKHGGVRVFTMAETSPTCTIRGLRKFGWISEMLTLARFYDSGKATPAPAIRPRIFRRLNPV